MPNILDSLKITTPYKAALPVTGLAFLIALSAHRDALMMIFEGLFSIALGEWRNHPHQTTGFKQTPAGLAKITNVPREANWAGNTLQAIGVAVALIGLYWVFKFGV